MRWRKRLSILDLEAFERAADLIFTARQRDFYGIGGSAQIARDVSHKFLRIGVRTSVFDDAHMMLMSAALLGRGRRRGRLLAFGQHHRRDRGPGAGPPARRAHHRADQLCRPRRWPRWPTWCCARPRKDRRCWARTPPRASPSSIIFDAVFVAVAQRDLKAAERNLAATMGAVIAKRRTHMTAVEQARRGGGRQPPLRHHGRCAGPAAQGRDGDRLRLAPEIRRQGRQPGRRGGEGRRRGPHGRRGRRRRVRPLPSGCGSAPAASMHRVSQRLPDARLGHERRDLRCRRGLWRRDRLGREPPRRSRRPQPNQASGRAPAR